MGDALMGAMTDVMHDVWMCCTDDAWVGAMTDAMHNVWTGCMDDAWMGAMTDIPYGVWTDGTDDAQMGAMTDVLYNVQMDGDFTEILCRSFTACFSPLLPGIFDSFSADGDEVMDGVPDGLTDKSVDV